MKTEDKAVVEEAQVPSLFTWIAKHFGPNRAQKRKARWMKIDGTPTVKHGLRARTPKAGIEKAKKAKRKIAEASRRRNRR